ncbi:MAG: hypothetical protein ACJ8CB_23235 [Ktedonobacteraceae bacterium]
MKRGSNLSWCTMVGVGVKPSWRNTPGRSQHRIAESRAGRPCSVGIRSERVEAVEGAAGRTTWTAVVGLADETSARGRLCGVSLVRSSRRQPSTTACPGGDDLPQGGVAACTYCVAAPTEERTLEIVTCETENGL